MRDHQRATRRVAGRGGAVADTGATSTGQAQAASEGLRGLGYNCSDSDFAGSLGVVKRVCSRVRMLRSSQVDMVLAESLGLEPVDRDAVQTTTASNEAQSLELHWGTLTVHTGGYSSDLRAANWKGTLRPAKTTLTASVDALAAAATRRGYVCTTPHITTIRACSRSQGGYDYELWMQGTRAYVTALDLEVDSTFHTQTRRRWGRR